MPHLNDKLDFTASALIVHDGRVLLRMHEKFHAWMDIGGHIELGEDPIEALLREVQEESGLEVEILFGEKKIFDSENRSIPTPQFMNRHQAGANHEHVDMIYVVKAKTLDIKPHQAESATEFKWFSFEDLQDPQYPIKLHTKYYAEQALTMVK